MKSKGIYRETKDYDRYFILSINDDNIKKIKEVPLNYDTSVNVNEKVYRLTLNFFTTLAVNLFTSSEVLTFN